MPMVTWEQDTDPRQLKLHFDSLGRSYYLTQPEVINQLVSSYNKDVLLHKDQQVFDADFSRLRSVPQKPGVLRNRSSIAQSTITTDVCSIEQNGQWLSTEGWQNERHFFSLYAIGRPIVSKTCRSCGTSNRAEAVYCSQCGSADLDPVYNA